MRKVLLIVLTTLFFVLSMVACGSKSDENNGNADVSRVLYSDNDSVAAETKQVTTTSKTESEKDTVTDSEPDSKVGEKDTVSKMDTESKKSSESSKSETSSSSSSKSDKTSQSSKSVSSAEITNVQSTAVVSDDPIDNQSSENSYESNSESASVSSETNENNSDTESNNPSEETSDNDIHSSGGFDESDLVVSINGAEIHLEDNINDVVAAFGQPIDIISAPSCKYSGFEDKTYIYDGFTVNTYPNADGSIDYVVGVEVTSDTYKTTKGIGIGSELDDVFKAYGEEYVTLGNTYRYMIDSKFISFYIDDDKVNSISYIFDN